MAPIKHHASIMQASCKHHVAAETARRDLLPCSATLDDPEGCPQQLPSGIKRGQAPVASDVPARATCEEVLVVVPQLRQSFVGHACRSMACSYMR
jgi:hypothetical protein